VLKAEVFLGGGGLVGWEDGRELGLVNNAPIPDPKGRREVLWLWLV